MAGSSSPFSFGDLLTVELSRAGLVLPACAVPQALAQRLGSEDTTVGVRGGAGGGGNRASHEQIGCSELTCAASQVLQRRRCRQHSKRRLARERAAVACPPVLPAQ